jgi:hypothetical protein
MEITMSERIHPRTVGLWTFTGLAMLLAFSFAHLSAQTRQSAAAAAAAGGMGRGGSWDAQIERTSRQMLEEGRQIFRFDTFGDEAFWGGQLRLHEAVRTLSPRAALQLGLKVDSDALPPGMLAAIRRGRLNLEDPAVTLDLLRRDAVVGVTGFFGSPGAQGEPGPQLTAVGIQCALCHSNVDDAVTAGIGRRLDGWPNSDLDIGKLIASAPDLSLFAMLLGLTQDQVRAVLNTWGPGMFDAELLLDGKTTNPVTGRSAATLNPPAFGLAGVNNHTWTGAWGTVSYWNAFVANLEMRGKGTFFDPRLDDPVKYRIAAAHPELFGHKRDPVDLITGKLPALHHYQLSIPKPEPPPGTFNPAAAARGELLFDGRARCATCHVPPAAADAPGTTGLLNPRGRLRPTFTEPGWNLHTGAEIGIEEFQAQRAPDNRYRTTPLRALWDTQKTHKRGFYHDGRFATLGDVVDHYDGFFGLGLSTAERTDLTEYLKSL